MYSRYCADSGVDLSRLEVEGPSVGAAEEAEGGGGEEGRLREWWLGRWEFVEDLLRAEGAD